MSFVPCGCRSPQSIVHPTYMKLFRTGFSWAAETPFDAPTHTQLQAIDCGEEQRQCGRRAARDAGDGIVPFLCLKPRTKTVLDGAMEPPKALSTTRRRVG